MAQVGEIATTGVLVLSVFFFIIQLKLERYRRSCRLFCIHQGAFGFIIKQNEKKNRFIA